MRFDVEDVNGVSVIRIPVQMLDANNCEDFKRDISSSLTENDRIVFDLSKVLFIDSSGCGALLSCLKTVRNNEGKLKLCRISNPVHTIFDLLHFYSVFNIANTRKEAVESF